MKNTFLDKLLTRLDRVGQADLQAYLQRLSKEKGFFETIFNTLQEGIVVVDSSGRIRYLNHAITTLLGLDPANYPIARMTYDLRRLRLHGIIQRIPKTHRYQLTPDGLRIALFFSRTYVRLLRPKLAEILPKVVSPLNTPLRAAFDRLTAEIHACCQEQRLVA